MFTHGGIRLLVAIIGIVSCGGGDSNMPAVDGQSAGDLPELPPRVETRDAPRGPELPLRNLQIALVGELRGEVEPCGCPTLPFGGFERRSRMLDNLRAEGPLLHLDAGELLLKGVSTARTENRQTRIQAMLDLSAEAGIHAWTPGPTDIMAIGAEGLSDIADGSRSGPPPVSATWLDSSGETWLDSSLIIELDSLRVGVIGLSSEPSKSDFTTPSGESLIWKDPVLAVRDSLASLPQDLDLVIALSNLSDEDNQRVAEETEGVALLLSTRGRDLNEPRSFSAENGTGGTLWVETPDRGRYLQLIRLQLGSNSDMRPILAPPLQDWRDLRTARQQRESRRQSGETISDELHASEALFKEMGRGRNLALIDTLPLAKDLDGESNLTARVAQFKTDTLTEAAEIAAAPLPPLQPTYASSGGCPSCHSQEFSRWSYTNHSRAYETLLREQQGDNPECVECHTTGFAQPGGFGSLERTHIRKFKAVQCEACHGPLQGHPDDPRVESVPITESQCVGCHDPANSPQFDFEVYNWKATCQSHEGMTPPAGLDFGDHE